MATTYYTTHGDIRRGCGHKHRTLGAAQECLLHDKRGCAVQGGYSDRVVAEIHDGHLWRVGGSDWIPGPGGRTSGAATLGQAGLEEEEDNCAPLLP